MRPVLLPKILAVSLLTLAAVGFSEDSRVADEHRLQVREVEQAIQWVRPQLPFQRITLFANAIVAAGKKYGVEPLTLVAIAHQESSFRENLPTGRAGEVGMLQIRKVWLKNPKFRRAFRKATVADLKNPEKAFHFAAWILKDLKRGGRGESLPYWTYYNARKFQNRFKYYLRVKRHLTAIEIKRTQSQQALLASSASLPSFEEWQPEIPARRQLTENVAPAPLPVNPAQNILRQIDWPQKAIEVLQRES